ncbi:MAG: Lrp/AsnC family transcriptional regulator [Crenarchaeota archaeon]|nr:Lrp/AsnC family transcriptional regulator [Thermoproteota archaeon]
MAQNPTLDEKDLAILRLLALNGRMPFTEIGRRVGLSDVAVIKRVRRLESSGVIKRYTIEVDPAKLGYRAVSITGIDTEPQNLFQVVEKLKAMDCVKYIALTSGDHSVMTIIWARDGDDMARIHESISKLPGVKRVCPAVILEVFKDERV